MAVEKFDKSTWGEGPWQQEPDKVQWTDEKTGLPCLAVRNYHGAWCGYAGVSKKHAYYGAHYDEIGDVEVHGGLTYSRECQGNICHETEKKDHVWWFGFDCSHYLDLSPAMVAMMNDAYKRMGEERTKRDDDVYRDLDYVKSETTCLASQLKEKDEAARRLFGPLSIWFVRTRLRLRCAWRQSRAHNRLTHWKMRWFLYLRKRKRWDYSPAEIAHRKQLTKKVWTTWTTLCKKVGWLVVFFPRAPLAALRAYIKIWTVRRTIKP